MQEIALNRHVVVPQSVEVETLVILDDPSEMCDDVQIP